MRFHHQNEGKKVRVRANVGKGLVPNEITAGVVGMGLMGASIAACLLIAGHPVAAVEDIDSKSRSASRRVVRLLEEARQERLLNKPVSTLIESGYATIEDVDRSFRNDLGYWITFAGPFRFMDLTGIPA